MVYSLSFSTRRNVSDSSIPANFSLNHFNSCLIKVLIFDDANHPFFEYVVLIFFFSFLMENQRCDLLLHPHLHQFPHQSSVNEDQNPYFSSSCSSSHFKPLFNQCSCLLPHPTIIINCWSSLPPPNTHLLSVKKLKIFKNSIYKLPSVLREKKKKK